MSASAGRLAFRLRWDDEHTPVRELLPGLLRVSGNLIVDPPWQPVADDAYATQLLQHAGIASALVGEGVVGLAALYANDPVTDTAHVPLMAVLPACHQQGVGKALMSRAIARARDRGMHTMWLTVDQDNRLAQRLFAAFGYRVFGTKPPKLRMELPLTEQCDVLLPKATPRESASRLATALGLDVDLRRMRDDLYPISGGGVLAWTMGYIVKDAIERRYVTNGDPQSNHARATAIVAAKLGLQCHLVVVLDPQPPIRRAAMSFSCS